MAAAKKLSVWLFNVRVGGAAILSKSIEGASWDEASNYQPYEPDSGTLLLEYDAVIWRTPNPLGSHPERNRQLQSFLDRGSKVFVFLLDPYKEVNAVSSFSTIGIIMPLLASQDSRFWDAINRTKQGRRFSLTPEGQTSPFREYLESKPNHWYLSFDNRHWLVPLALNSEGEAVAFSLRAFRSRSFFLPAPYNDEQTSIFLKNLFEAISRLRDSDEPAPTWTEKFFLPGMKDLRDSIERLNSGIAKLHEELSDHQAQLSRFIWIRNTLLSSDGKALERAVKEVFEAVGYSPVPGPIGEHDLTFQCQGRQFLAEIKGATSSASEQHIKQLHAKLTQFVEKEEIEAKPVLIINPWRQFDPRERGTGERPLFPDAIMKLVKIWKICLMTSLQVLEIYRLHLEGKLDPKRLSEEIDSTVGPLKGYQLQGGGG